jgi:hypothetical protein
VWTEPVLRVSDGGRVGRDRIEELLLLGGREECAAAEAVDPLDDVARRRCHRAGGPHPGHVVEVGHVLPAVVPARQHVIAERLVAREKGLGEVERLEDA